MKKSETITNTEQELLSQKKSFQEWLPIEDVDRGFIKVKNYSHDEYYPVISIGEVNIDLMTKPELYTFARNIETVIASLNIIDFQILLMPVPYDIEDWLQHVDQRTEELEQMRSDIDRKIHDAVQSGDPLADLDTLNADHASLDFYLSHLSGQRAYVVNKLSDGTIVCKKAFFVPRFDGLNSLGEYQDATTTVVRRFNDVIPGTTQLNNQAIRNMLFTVLNPLHQQYIRVPAMQFPTHLK